MSNLDKEVKVSQDKSYSNPKVILYHNITVLPYTMNLLINFKIKAIIKRIFIKILIKKLKKITKKIKNLQK